MASTLPISTSELLCAERVADRSKARSSAIRAEKMYEVIIDGVPIVSSLV